MIATLAFLFFVSPSLQRSGNLLHECRAVYEEAALFKHKVDTKEVNRLLVQKQLKYEDKVALYYALAMSRYQTDRSVQHMVDESMADWHAGGVSESFEAMPEALYEVFDHTGSKRAGNFLMTLDLDGAPAEILSDIHIQMLQEHPKFVATWLRTRYRTPEAAVWHTHFRKYESFTVDLYDETEYDHGLRAKLRKLFAGKKTPFARFLERYLIKLPHLTP